MSEEELKQRLNDKHSIESWRAISKVERASRLRGAYLTPGSAIFAQCEALGLGLQALSKITEDNKFRAREFLDAGERSHEHHAHGIDEHESDLEEHSGRITAALALVNALLDPRSFPESQTQEYQAIDGWQSEVSTVTLPDGRPGWATLPVTDADGEPLCGRVITDLQGNVVGIEGARLLSNGARLGKGEPGLTVLIDGKAYRVTLSGKSPRAFPETTSEGNLDNGRVFRLSDVKNVADEAGKITIEKGLQKRLERMGFDSKEGIASILRSLLSIYPTDELGLRVEDERAGWKKAFGGGKVRALTFVTRIPEGFMEALPSASRQENGKRVADHARLLALIGPFGTDERATQYGLQSPLYPNVSDRAASLPELARGRETVEVSLGAKERLRDILSISDRPFYEEWLQRTPAQQQLQRMRLVVQYGRDHLLSVTDLQLRNEKNPERQDRFHSIKRAVSDPDFLGKALAYVFGSRTVPPPFLPDVLYHGRMLASQLANGNMGEYLEGRKEHLDAPENIHTVQDILSTISGTTESAHDEPSLRQALKNAVITLETEGFTDLTTEYRVEIPLGQSFSFKPELSGGLGQDGIRPESAVFLQREFHLGKDKNVLLEVGAGPTGPHVHLVRQAKTSFSLDIETGWSWAGFGMEVDGWVQWYDARQRSDAEWKRTRADAGLVGLASKLSLSASTTHNDEERLAVLHRRITSPATTPQEETLRRFILREVRGYLGDTGQATDQSQRSEVVLFLRALQAYDAALQESSAYTIADRAPRITGVKFGLLLEDGAVIPLFGPILRKGIRLQRSYRLGRVGDVDEGDLEARLATAPRLRSTGSGIDADGINAELRKTTIHPHEGGTYRFTFDALAKNPYRDRTTYEVYADPEVGFSWDRATNAITASGFSFVLERTVIAANGLPLVRLELYREKPHGGHDDHHHDPRILLARSIPFPARTAKGHTTGGLVRQTFTVASHPAQAPGPAIPPENVQAVSRLEQQPILPGHVEIKDRRSYGFFANPFRPSETGIQFIPGAGHVH